MLQLAPSPLMNRAIPQEDADALYRIYPDLPRSYLSGCPSCGKNRGYGVNGVLVINGVEVGCNCRDQLQRHKHYLNSGIGSAYHFITWSDFKGDPDAFAQVESWAGSLDRNIEAGKGMFIFGEQNGTGKTMLASLALKECIQRGHRCYSTTFQNMLASMKSGWKDAEFEKWYRNKIDSAQVLLIDDLGKELSQSSGFNLDFAKQTLDSLLRTRVQQGRPTIFTSNMPPGRVQQEYGMAVSSLMAETSASIGVRGFDFRPNVEHAAKGFRRIY